MLSSLAVVTGFSSSGTTLRVANFDASQQLRLRSSSTGTAARPSSHVRSVSFETNTQAVDELDVTPVTPAFRGKAPVLTADGAY